MQPWMIYMLHSTHKRLQGRWDRTRQDSSWRREQKTELLTLGVQFVLNSTSLPADKFGQRCRQHCETVKICFLSVKSSSNQILRPRWCICCISTTLDGHTSVWPLDWHILDRAQEHILPVCVGCYLCHLTLFFLHWSRWKHRGRLKEDDSKLCRACPSTSLTWTNFSLLS